MHIREYQQWVQAWDQARTWDRILPGHVMLHALEELGEVSKLVQMIEGYRDPKDKTMDEIRSALALELSDLQVMLFKIAYLCGIDMEDALHRGQFKADQRFPDPATGPADQAAYWQRLQSYMVQAGLDASLPISPHLMDTDSKPRPVENRQPIDPFLTD